PSSGFMWQLRINVGISTLYCPIGSGIGLTSGTACCVRFLTSVTCGSQPARQFQDLIGRWYLWATLRLLGGASAYAVGSLFGRPSPRRGRPAGGIDGYLGERGSGGSAFAPQAGAPSAPSSACGTWPRLPPALCGHRRRR